MSPGIIQLLLKVIFKLFNFILITTLKKQEKKMSPSLVLIGRERSEANLALQEFPNFKREDKTENNIKPLTI